MHSGDCRSGSLFGAKYVTKYHAKRTECGAGHMHDSGMESKRCDQLRALEDAGEIDRLEQQPEFRVEINGKLICRYVADFAWFTKDCRVIEDVKGTVTPVFNLKKKMVEAYHPGTVITIWPPKVRKKRKTTVAKAAATKRLRKQLVASLEE